MRTWPAISAIFLLAGCSGEGAETPSDPPDDTLAPPEVGAQLVTEETTLAPGEERYACWSFDLPADAPLYLTGLETQITGAGVHHYGIFTNSLAGSSTEEAYDCEAMGATWGLVSGGGIGTPPVRFPEGTAMALEGGTHIIVQLHLLNTGGEEATIPPQRFNLVGTEPAETLQPVGLLIAGTLDLTIPAHQMGVAVTGGCAVAEPLEHVFAAYPHMHKLGRRITTEAVPSGGGAGQMLSDIVWDFKDQGFYEVDGSVMAGDQVVVTCYFDNAGDADVHFGLSSSDEMCINVLYYYPATALSKYCGIGN